MSNLSLLVGEGWEIPTIRCIVSTCSQLHLSRIVQLYSWKQIKQMNIINVTSMIVMIINAVKF
ncbi:hypothetical protein BLOT_007372 [Blomia tropicalis]|nr:hypothetical protein BLOT_007372 [Blomia tropicalis]